MENILCFLGLHKRTKAINMPYVDLDKRQVISKSYHCPRCDCDFITLHNDPIGFFHNKIENIEATPENFNRVRDEVYIFFDWDKKNEISLRESVLNLRLKILKLEAITDSLTK